MRLLWKLYLSFVGLVLVTALLVGLIVSRWLEQDVHNRIEVRLRMRHTEKVVVQTTLHEAITGALLRTRTASTACASSSTAAAFVSCRRGRTSPAASAVGHLRWRRSLSTRPPALAQVLLDARHSRHQRCRYSTAILVEQLCRLRK